MLTVSKLVLPLRVTIAHLARIALAALTRNCHADANRALRATAVQTVPIARAVRTAPTALVAKTLRA